MSWEHQLDVQKWMGERTPRHANEMEYDRKLVQDFIYDFTLFSSRMPDVRDILDGLGYPDRFYDDVRITLSNYDHEEEVIFRS